ncbi:hypothetical protein IMX26_04810 [Clostridium sp. 'deep sea']|uniref:hypothetical protein n=1 Tax=Clostridium sp. 'deep sea' TaxID=2779445 RepID=UPI00189679F4|nr:hypothetical protein [Clostridium sp. 'deep sea']QOR36137.1 hypothetical protein IMX26_04810 [Clostridium sp. 'deep sea']
MQNMRLFYRSLNAQRAITQFNGFLPSVIDHQVAIELCNLQSGQPVDNEILQKLIKHNIVVKKNNGYYSKIAMLSCNLSKEIELNIKQELKDIDFSGSKIVASMAKKLEADWQHIGHATITQLVLGIMWFNMNLKLGNEANNSVAILLPDMDLNHIFYNEIYPLFGNSSVVYWQSELLCHPDIVYDILNNINVVKSMRSLDDNYEFIPIGNGLVLLAKLKMYKNKKGNAGMTTTHVSLPEVNKYHVNKIKSELKKFAELFYSIYPKLASISNKLYKNRKDSQVEISEFSFNQMVYLVFSYCVVENWLKSGNLPQYVPVKDKKKKQNSPTFSLQ